jgi:NADPH2:quinone reductase
VRVRHDAIGINLIDTYVRKGLYPTQLPAVLGTEGAGVVDAVGADVAHVAVGDRVAYVSRATGSYAEQRVVEGAAVVRLPDGIDTRRAAAMMLKGLTVQYLLRQMRVDLVAGDLIVWHAAAGGVGLIACQWAKALGYRVIATAGGPDKCALALAHGAAYAVDYRREDVAARVRELTGGAGVKAVFDPVGKDTWDGSLACLAPRGLMVSFGNASGAVPPISLLTLTRGSFYVTRPTLGTFTADRGILEIMASELFAIVSSGAVRIAAPREYPLADAARAHRELESRATTGAGVLIP